MAEDTFTNNQGIYAIIIFFNTHAGVYRLYIGSAYGKFGMGYRLYKNHFNAVYRKREPGKYLYRCMEHPNADSRPVCLVRFREQVEPAVVLFAEATMVSIFGTFPRRDYQEFQDPRLPAIDWDAGVNQSDPLMTGDNRELWKDSVMSKRRKKLDNARAGGPVRVAYTKPPKEAWMLRIFEQLQLLIPKATAIAWNLRGDSQVNVSYDIATDRHPNAFAIDAPDIIDGRVLGIKVSKEIDGEEKEIWLT